MLPRIVEYNNPVWCIHWQTEMLSEVQMWTTINQKLRIQGICTTDDMGSLCVQHVADQAGSRQTAGQQIRQGKGIGLTPGEGVGLSFDTPAKKVVIHCCEHCYHMCSSCRISAPVLIRNLLVEHNIKTLTGTYPFSQNFFFQGDRFHLEIVRAFESSFLA